MKQNEDYIAMEGKVLDAVAAGCVIPFLVALRLGIQTWQATALLKRLVERGLLRQIQRQDFLGTWYEYEERLP